MVGLRLSPWRPPCGGFFRRFIPASVQGRRGSRNLRLPIHAAGAGAAGERGSIVVTIPRSSRCSHRWICSNSWGQSADNRRFRKASKSRSTRLDQVPHLADSLFQSEPVVPLLDGRQLGPADGQRLGLERQFVLLFVPHQDHARLTRQLTGLDRSPCLRQLRRVVAADRLVARHCPRGQSRTSVRASITATTEPSASGMVSASVSSTNQSQSRNSLPR